MVLSGWLGRVYGGEEGRWEWDTHAPAHDILRYSGPVGVSGMKEVVAEVSSALVEELSSWALLLCSCPSPPLSSFSLVLHSCLA